MTANEETKKVAELLDGARFAMLTTVDEDGRFISRPMAQQEVEFDGDLWFFAESGSRKTKHISANSNVNVTISDSSKWVSLSGQAEVVVDVEKAKELWNAGAEAWFPDGPGTSNLVLIHVEAESAEYWDNPGGRIASLASFAKSKITGQRYSGGENKKVDL